MSRGTHPVPPISHPSGRFRDQPDRGDMLVDDAYALMSARTLDALAEYSASLPTGVYEGKMWRRRFRDGWALGWYGPSPHAGCCSVNFRPVLVVA